MPLSFAQILRDFITDGVPSSGANKPKKSEMRAWGSWVESIISAFTSNGGLIYSSLALLNADLARAANTMAWVVGDATAANNGVYGKVGASGTGSWTRRSDLPFSFIIGADAGAGTANAIQSTTSLPVSSSALVVTNVFRVNTGSPVTISFNGGAALTIKSNSGNDIVAGGIVAGMLIFGYVSGSTFRLISDQVGSAIVAAAEAAAAAAAASAASINLPSISAGDKGYGLTVNTAGNGYDKNPVSIVALTRTALKALTTAIDRPVYLAESGREGMFKLRTGSPPVSDTQEGVYVVSNTAGFYWERAYGAALPSVRAFGAVQDAVTDDTAAFQGALDVLGSAIMLASQGLKSKISGTIRLKNDRNHLLGVGRPWLVSGTATPIYVESSFQKVGGFVIDGAASVANTAIRIRTSLRQMTTIDIGDLYLQDCFNGIQDDNSTNVAIFVKIHDITMAGHRGYGIATWDCWASYHIDQVVVDRVGKSGVDYNYPAFYFNGAEGIFFRNCAHNGSSATGIQALQDGAVFEICNFVEFTNFIPDHSGGRGMVFITCANVKGDKSTLVNCGNHGLVASGGSMFDLDSITSTQLAASATLADAFNIDSVQGFRAKGLYGTGFKRNGIFANACQRMNVQGEFSSNANRGIVTLGASSANLFHGCLTASNTAGNYSLVASSDYLRDHIVSAGTIGDATGPATA
ncbi:hypothetical protein [Rhizobium grahamii]|uniref:Pectate lyase superfamily protein domain-containing protein n=1 Tax=Rhizobium grahamii CCGE 502 TaxID=990285 RepID=S3HIQ0_9HYPH|nr:hypothetical protein [Rhizobium grahamii]EPE98622.1 hypothetical protein RGCCGE502_09355 [Rhizobium grahamii CCGE 502]